MSLSQLRLSHSSVTKNKKQKNKKNLTTAVRQTETPKPQTQSHIQIQFTIIFCQKKNNTISQSQIHNTNIISMLF